MLNFTLEEQKELLTIAQKSIEFGLNFNSPLVPELANYSPLLQTKLASFVTLEINKRLRGCIGSLLGRYPLITDVANNAFAAAFRDPRFTKLTAPELKQISLHISVLSEPTPIHFTSEADLLQQLQPTIDGLILIENNKQSTFLPTVWEQLPNPQDFLHHLKIKGGWEQNYWSANMQVLRYTTTLIE